MVIKLSSPKCGRTRTRQAVVHVVALCQVVVGTSWARELVGILCATRTVGA